MHPSGSSLTTKSFTYIGRVAILVSCNFEDIYFFQYFQGTKQIWLGHPTRLALGNLSAFIYDLRLCCTQGRAGRFGCPSRFFPFLPLKYY